MKPYKILQVRKQSTMEKVIIEPYVVESLQEERKKLSLVYGKVDIDYLKIEK